MASFAHLEGMLKLRCFWGVIFVVFLSLNGGCQFVTGGEDYDTIQRRLFQKAHDSKKYDFLIESLPPYLKNFKTDEDLAWGNYLLGSAHFMRAESDLSHLNNKTRMFVAIPDRTIQDLKISLKYFDEAVWYDKNGDLSVKALFLSGRALDVGFLQRFPEAMMFYQRVMGISLESESGQMALERYRILSEWYGGKMSGFN